jgi:hypothetical protein
MKKQMIVITVGPMDYTEVFFVDSIHDNESTLWACYNVLSNDYPLWGKDRNWLANLGYRDPMDPIKDALGTALFDYLSSYVRRYGEITYWDKLSTRSILCEKGVRVKIRVSVRRDTPANRLLLKEQLINK